MVVKGDGSIPARMAKKSRRSSGSPPVKRSVVTPMSPSRPIRAMAASELM
jgi:hypothetical protein